jgi:hypothetical protein
LTRVSIDLEKTLAKKMDGRVKPGHDDSSRTTNVHAALETSSPAFTAIASTQDKTQAPL